jgi:hypothetical protein
MDLADLNHFFRLQWILSHQLQAKTVGLSNVAAIILHRKILPDAEQEVLLQALRFVVDAYGDHRRRLGPLAVLHPLSVAALLSRAVERPTLEGQLVSLTHDVLEDLTVEKLGEARFRRMQADLQRLLEKIGRIGEFDLMAHLDCLSRRPGENYFQYVGRMLDQASDKPAVLRVKVCDGLGNTLDLWNDLEDPMRGVDFFEVVFRLLFVNSYTGYKPELPRPPPSPFSRAERLYRLFKATVVMSLYRKRRVTDDDPGIRKLFEALAVAGMRESQRVVLSLWAHDLPYVLEQRALLMDVLNYAQQGYLDRANYPSPNRRLDGLFLTRFEDSDHEIRKQKLANLDSDIPLLLDGALAFSVIFESFLNPGFRVRGITEEGIRP